MDEELYCNHGTFLTQVRTFVFPLFEVSDTATSPSQELREPASLDEADGVVVLQVVYLVPDRLDVLLANTTFP